MADFTLFVGIKKILFNYLGMAVALLRHPGGMKISTSLQFFQTRMADFTLFVGIKKILFTIFLGWPSLCSGIPGV